MTGSHIRNRFWLPNMALAPALVWAVPARLGPGRAKPRRTAPNRAGRGGAANRPRLAITA